MLCALVVAAVPASGLKWFFIAAAVIGFVKGVLDVLQGEE